MSHYVQVIKWQAILIIMAFGGPGFPCRKIFGGSWIIHEVTKGRISRLAVSRYVTASPRKVGQEGESLVWPDIWDSLGPGKRRYNLSELDAPKPKFLPGLVSPIKVWFQRWPKKGSDSTWKFLCLRPSKLSKTWLVDILDIFFNYFNVIQGVFCFSWKRPSQNFYLV